MNDEIAYVQRKWRPSVRLILLALNLTVLMMPVAGLLFFRIYENQLVRETERELISQAAVLAAVFKRALEFEFDGDIESVTRKVMHTPGAGVDKRFLPVAPEIDLTNSKLRPPRPDGQPGAGQIDARLRKAGDTTIAIFQETQRITLAGLRLLNADGRVIGGPKEFGFSFAEVDEVRRALSGRYASAIRERFSDSPLPTLTSIGRSAGVRVFIGFPVVDKERLYGVLYMSRTPDNIWRRLYGAWDKVMLAIVTLLTITVALVLVTSRTIIAPIDALNRQAALIANGRHAVVAPIRRAGTREIAGLANSIVDMANALHRRARYIREFAVTVGHEFKTPLTSIQGATELLLEENGDMATADRKHFLANIRGDARRMEHLISRLNDLARADNPIKDDEIIDVVETLQHFAQTNKSIELDLGVGGAASAKVCISEDTLILIASNLCANAAQAGANRLEITVQDNCAQGFIDLSFHDDGPGVASVERELIFEPFHTTRRDLGGTGLGLRIVQSLAEAHGGSVWLDNSTHGAHFVVRLPRVQCLDDGIDL